MLTGLDALQRSCEPPRLRLSNTKGSVSPLPLAHDDHDLALAGLVLGKAAIDAVFLVVRGLDVAAEVRAVDLDLARDGAVVGYRRAMASRILCASTKAVLYWQSRSRLSCRALWPFAPFTKIAMARR